MVSLLDFELLEQVLPNIPDISPDIPDLELEEDTRTDAFVSDIDDMLEYFRRLKFENLMKKCLSLTKGRTNLLEYGSCDNTVDIPETKSDNKMNQNASNDLQVQKKSVKKNKKNSKRPYTKKHPSEKESKRPDTKKHPSLKERLVLRRIRNKVGTPIFDEVRAHVHVYTPEEKALRITRFKQKKNRPKKKKNTTDCGRKRFAKERPRVGGRFVQMKNKQTKKNRRQIE